MTREEAIAEIQYYMNSDSYADAPSNEACKIAIEALALPQPSNEPLMLISMEDALPPDNDRVLVYRPCMADADTGPYSVQWGWSAKRDGSHWAHLPDRRPPEGEEDK